MVEKTGGADLEQITAYTNNTICKYTVKYIYDSIYALLCNCRLCYSVVMNNIHIGCVYVMIFVHGVYKYRDRIR